MNEQEILNTYKKPEDKICLAQVLDKIKLSQTKNITQNTNFLDMYQIALVKNFLNKIKQEQYQLWGGYENAERQIFIALPDKEAFSKQTLKVVRITLPEEEKGKYAHRNYLGGIVKLGLKREMVGDILVDENGADIIVVSDFATILKEELKKLTRFENSKIEIVEIENLRKPNIQKEEIKIIVASLRLDNIVSDLARSSRSKSVEIIKQERVFINGQNETKVSKQVKINDVITIRGKGRFIIKGITGTTRSGRPVITVEKYV